MKIVMDEMGINRSVRRISHEIIEKNKGLDDVVLVGIKSRGIELAQMIKQNIEDFEGVSLELGIVDITGYRDDRIGDKGINETLVDFNINNKKIILVDDVLKSGRTIRAAIQVVMEMGRPKEIQLCTLIDRGHRELPIRPDYVGKNIPTSKNEIVKVHLKPRDELQEVTIIE